MPPKRKKGYLKMRAERLARKESATDDVDPTSPISTPTIKPTRPPSTPGPEKKKRRRKKSRTKFTQSKKSKFTKTQYTNLASTLNSNANPIHIKSEPDVNSSLPVYETESQPEITSPISVFAMEDHKFPGGYVFAAKSKPGAAYVFIGRRLVNMGYFLKSLQKLNDHPGYSCNFSNMEVRAEVSQGWNIGIVFTCRLCPTSKMVWMEDPASPFPPPSPIIQDNSAEHNRTPFKAQVPTNNVFEFRGPTTQGTTPDGEFIQPSQPIQVLKEHLFKEQMHIQENTTSCCGPPQPPSNGPVVIVEQVPDIEESSCEICAHLSQNSMLQSDVADQSNQETVLPDDGQSGLQPAPDIVKVELSFCVDDQPDADNDLTSASMEVSESLSSNPHGDNSSSHSTSAQTIFTLNDTAENTSAMLTNGDILPVDLNLVKIEIDDDIT